MKHTCKHAECCECCECSEGHNMRFTALIPKEEIEQMIKKDLELKGHKVKELRWNISPEEDYRGDKTGDYRLELEAILS